jgi:hypothetical protein
MTQPPYIAVLEYTDLFLSVKEKNSSALLFLDSQSRTSYTYNTQMQTLIKANPLERYSRKGILIDKKACSRRLGTVGLEMGKHFLL